MIVSVESVDRFLSEMKQPRELGTSQIAALYIKKKEDTPTILVKPEILRALVIVVGTPYGNLILDKGYYPTAFIKRDDETDDNFLVIANADTQKEPSYVYSLINKTFDGSESYSKCNSVPELLNKVTSDPRFA